MYKRSGINYVQRTLKDKHKEKYSVLRENIKLLLKRMCLIRTFEDKENLRHFCLLHPSQEAADMFSIKIGKHTKQEESMEFRKQLSRGDVPVKSDGKSQKRSFVADLEEHQTIWNRRAEGSSGVRWWGGGAEGGFSKGRDGNYVFDIVEIHLERQLFVVGRTSITTLKNMNVLM